MSTSTATGIASDTNNDTGKQPMNVPYYFTYYIKRFNSKVYVPKALLDTYKTTKTYWNLIPAENFYQIEGNVPESGILASVKPIESVGKATVKAIYTLNGTKVNSLQHGINIVKMSDGTVRKVIFWSSLTTSA